MYGRGRAEFSHVTLMHIAAATAEQCRLHSSFFLNLASALEGITVACETSSSLLIHEICITEFPDYTYPHRIRLHSQGLKLAESRFDSVHLMHVHVRLGCIHTRAFGVEPCPFVIHIRLAFITIVKHTWVHIKWRTRIHSFNPDNIGCRMSFFLFNITSSEFSWLLWARSVVILRLLHASSRTQRHTYLSPDKLHSESSSHALCFLQYICGRQTCMLFYVL